MSRKFSGWLAVFLATGTLGLFLWFMVVGSAGATAFQEENLILAAPPTQPANQNAEPRRDRDGDPSATTISFIDNPTAGCFRPKEHTDVCYIDWQYLNVSASTSQYIISMTVEISHELRAYYSGFFQTSMYIPGDLQGSGFKVACGLPGAGGNPLFGRAYPYTVRARESSGLKAANYGTVYCPSDVIPVQNAMLAGPNSVFVAHPYLFTASVPVTTTLPVTYTWTVSGQAMRTVSGGVNDQQSYTWTTPGSKIFSVEVANRAGTIHLSKTVVVNPIQLFLPILRR